MGNICWQRKQVKGKIVKNSGFLSPGLGFIAVEKIIYICRYTNINSLGIACIGDPILLDLKRHWKISFWG